jgi:hypothetical protein
MKMSRQVAEDLLGRMRERYAQPGRQAKGGYSASFPSGAATGGSTRFKVLGRKKGVSPAGGKRGGPCRHGEKVQEALEKDLASWTRDVWEALVHGDVGLASLPPETLWEVA